MTLHYFRTSDVQVGRQCGKTWWVSLERTLAELLRVDKLVCTVCERHRTKSAGTQRNLITKGPLHSMYSLLSLDNKVKTELGGKNSRNLHATRGVTSTAIVEVWPQPKSASPNPGVNVTTLHLESQETSHLNDAFKLKLFIFLIRYKLIYKLPK